MLEQRGDRCRLRFACRDTGIGMSAEQMSRIFAAFEQADMSTTRRFGGTGLRADDLLAAGRTDGGQLQVESTAGQGSRFWFEVDLPVAVEVPARECRMSVD
ncbi:MAG: ATP-binding protein [Planctomycetaceae bacterium]